MVTLDEKTGQILGIKPQYFSTFAAAFPSMQLIPEPATMTLLGVGMFAMGGWRRR